MARDGRKGSFRPLPSFSREADGPEHGPSVMARPERDAVTVLLSTE